MDPIVGSTPNIIIRNNTTPYTGTSAIATTDEIKNKTVKHYQVCSFNKHCKIHTDKESCGKTNMVMEEMYSHITSIVA